MCKRDALLRALRRVKAPEIPQKLLHEGKIIAMCRGCRLGVRDFDLIFTDVLNLIDDALVIKCDGDNTLFSNIFIENPMLLGFLPDIIPDIGIER